MSGHEVARFVEHPVVRQVVLDIAGHDAAVVDNRCRIDRRASWPTEQWSVDLIQHVEAADDDRDARVDGEIAGQRIQRSA